MKKLGSTALAPVTCIDKQRKFKGKTANYKITLQRHATQCNILRINLCAQMLSSWGAKALHLHRKRGQIPEQKSTLKVGDDWVTFENSCAVASSLEQAIGGLCQRTLLSGHRVELCL